MKKLLLIPLLLTSISGYCQTLWQKTETDMTPQQVTTLYPQATTPSKIEEYANNGKALLTISNYQVGNNSFDVKFIFRNEKLSSVKLDSNERASGVVFNSMNTLLTAKYGKPINAQVTDISKTVTWLNDGTTIRLSNIMGKLVINYKVDLSNEMNKL